MVFVSVVEAVASAKEKAANREQNGQDWQNHFKIEHIFRILDLV